MGSRITLSLQSLMGTPYIEVRLYDVEMSDGEDNPGGQGTLIPYAEVTFKPLRASNMDALVYNFDYHWHESKLELSADFNWFRYNERSPQREMLRALFEHGVGFKVHH